MKIILSVISVYAPTCGLDDSHKDHFYDSLTNIVRKFGKKEIVVIIEEFNRHIGSNTENCEDQHGAYGYEVRNKEERILKFCAAMKIAVGIALFKKRESHLVSHGPGPSKTQVDYCLLRKTKRRF